ncbi:MAG: ammonium transporter, Amt family [Desulfomicrobiaceae bacterium]|jgi:Amt family ammonium transporter|nr:ammonium transporter, Amt family [Desulfomicrobiaceae bacterium]MDK2873838.1 ammonium transporter, Amt family [Desulfomicrobiaceae bacterium]HCF04650.1 ammonium transporter [Desulfomicrobiaceae bacterium]
MFAYPLFRPRRALLTALWVLGTPALALAEAPEFFTQSSANLLWTLIAAILVMFMQAGFAMVEAGFTRAKNAANIIMKNLLDFAAGSPAYFLVGFALMFGADAAGVFGTSGFALAGLDATTPEGQWTLTFWFFQSVFAATAATIVSGALAERTQFRTYIAASLAISALIYPISGHWAWGNLWLGDEGAGWLAQMGFVDFAGSSVVHALGGWIALAGALVLGPRIGKYGPDGAARAIPGHNIPLAGLGVFILWFGWFGFNPGSTTAATGDIGFIAVTTSLAACAGTLAAMAMAWMRFGKPDTSMALNGTLAGLVAITAGCAEVSPMGALAIGAIAGLVVVRSIEFIDKTLKIDDPVGASSVHGVCGTLGTILVGFFAAPGFGSATGLLYGGGAGLLLTQITGALAIAAWGFGCGFVLFKVLDALMGLRVSAEEELKGLDISEHGMEAYNGFQIFTNE